MRAWWTESEKSGGGVERRKCIEILLASHCEFSSHLHDMGTRASFASSGVFGGAGNELEWNGQAYLGTSYVCFREGGGNFLVGHESAKWRANGTEVSGDLLLGPHIGITLQTTENFVIISESRSNKKWVPCFHYANLPPSPTLYRQYPCWVLLSISFVCATMHYEIRDNWWTFNLCLKILRRQ